MQPGIVLCCRRKLLPRSGASLTYLPAGDGSGEGKVLIFGGQEPVGGAIFDDLLVSTRFFLGRNCQCGPALLHRAAKPSPAANFDAATRQSAECLRYMFDTLPSAQFTLQCLDTASWELTDVQLVATAAAAKGQQEQQQQEQQQRPPRPPARHSHVAGVYEQRGLVIFGGAGLRGPLADVWVWQPEEAAAEHGGGTSLAGCWRCLSVDLAEDECPDAREMAAGCMISEAGLLVHGGRGADGAVLDSIGIFDGRAGRWVLLQATGHARCAHTGCNVACSGEGSATGASTGSAAAGGTGGSGSSNVLLYGGFTGEAVAGDLLQLTFLRQQRSSGGPS